MIKVVTSEDIELSTWDVERSVEEEKLCLGLEGST